MAAETSVFYLPGMDCPVEEKLVRSRLEGMDGVHGLDFNLIQRKLKIKHDPDILQKLSFALAGLNMGATLLEEGAKPEQQMQDKPLAWKSLAWAVGLALISELVELYSEWAQLSESSKLVCEALSFVLAIAAIWLCGLGTYKKGWLAVKNRNLNITALMSVAVTGAVLIGQWPEAAMVMALFNVSEAIEGRALIKARNAISELMALAPHTAEVRQPDGSWQEVHAHDIAIGEIVRVKPGEKIPLDGRITSGNSAVNQAPITGESMPVEKSPGDFIYAGTLNGNGALEFETTATENDTTLARIIHAVEEAQGSRAPMQRIVDVFATWYTPAIFALGLICAFIPPLAFNASWLSSIYMGLVILVIGCPCALVISTPVTIVSGMAAATRKGILIKGGVFLEQGRRLKCLAFDKTGTITTGKPVITDIAPIGQISVEEAEKIAASLAARSDHPVSGAILAHAKQNNISALEVGAFEAIAGQGVRGVVDGAVFSLGNLRMAQFMGQVSAEVRQKITALEKTGKTVTLLMNPKGVLAIFAVADAIRPGAAKALEKLRNMGLTTVMLTGDNELAATAIATEAGMEKVKANLLPGEKLEAVEQMQTQYGMTGMVGDGINDAPALAAANISFAMASEGTDTAMETADVALMDDDLGKLPTFIELSRVTFAILIENISIALAIKLVFFALAFLGQATMWMAVFADVGAALIVIGNGLRALKK